MIPFFRHKATFTLTFLVLCALCSSLLLPATTTEAAGGTKIVLSPVYGPPTSTVQVTGSGFGASETVIINFDKTQVGTATTNSAGAFVANITVPASALPGKHKIKATGASSKLSAKSAFLVRTDWPMSGFDPQHTRFNPYENVLNTGNVSQLVQDWASPIPGSASSAPIVYNNIAYLGVSVVSPPTYEFDAFNATTGKKLWSYPIHTNVEAAAANNIVYVGAGGLYAFQAKTGKLLWIGQTTGYINSAPTVVNGVVYVGDSDEGAAYAFDVSNGNLLWSTLADAGINTSLTVANGIVYFGTFLSTIYALNAQNGNIEWTFVAGYDSLSSIAVSQNLVYVSASNLYALNASSGTIAWTVAVGPQTSPTVANGVVYVGAGNLLYAFNAATGAQLWNISLSAGFISSLTVANGVIYLSEYQIRLVLLGFNASSGATLWTDQFSGNWYSTSLTVVNGMVYVGIDITNPMVEHDLYAFHIASDAHQ